MPKFNHKAHIEMWDKIVGFIQEFKPNTPVPTLTELKERALTEEQKRLNYLCYACVYADEMKKELGEKSRCTLCPLDYTACDSEDSCYEQLINLFDLWGLIEGLDATQLKTAVELAKGIRDASINKGVEILNEEEADALIDEIIRREE